jgi:hypothetical protein
MVALVAVIAACGLTAVPAGAAEVSPPPYVICNMDAPANTNSGPFGLFFACQYGPTSSTATAFTPYIYRDANYGFGLADGDAATTFTVTGPGRFRAYKSQASYGSYSINTQCGGTAVVGGTNRESANGHLSCTRVSSAGAYPDYPTTFFAGGDTGAAPVITDGHFPAYECSRVIREVEGVWYADFSARALQAPTATEHDYVYWNGNTADPDTLSTQESDHDGDLQWTQKLGTLAEIDALPGHPTGTDGALQMSFFVFRHLDATPDEHHFDTSTWPPDAGPDVIPAHVANANIETATNGRVPSGSSYVEAECALVQNPRSPEAGAVNFTGGSYIDPDVDVDPNGGSYAERLRLCVPAGLGILNPSNFVTSLGCVLKWAFIPQDDFGAHVAELANETQSTALAIPTGGLSAVFGSFGRLRTSYEGASEDGCNGPSFTLPSNVNLGDVANRTIHPMSSCEEPMANAALWSRRIQLLVFYVGFGFFLSGLFLKTVLGVTPGKAIDLGVGEPHDSNGFRLYR